MVALPDDGEAPRDAFDDTSGSRFGGLADFLSQGNVAAPDPAQLVKLAVAAVPRSAHACLTLVDRHDRLQTLAASDEVASALDRVQLELADGPGMDTVHDLDVVHIPDLVTGGNWDEFAARARSIGVHTLLSVRLPIEGLGRASLTFYGDAPGTFTEFDLEMAAICGSVLGLTLRSARDRERTVNLEIALATNRHIGTAIGILMARSLLTADQAFEQLRETSQRMHRKLREVADEVVNTGQLPTP